MKDFLDKEIAYYNYLNKLETMYVPNVTHAMPLKTSSIDKLVEHFVAKLQTDFPSTVHTILRTTEKLKTPMAKHQLYCVLCSAYVEKIFVSLYS